MEPMTLGSPNTSHNTSAIFDVTTASNSQFLPSFLLGSETNNDSFCTSPKATSPRKPQFNTFQTSSAHNISVEKNLFPNPLSSIEKHDGPPIISLADYSVNPVNQSSVSSHLNVTRNDSRDFQVEEFIENWVTVFGFSPSQVDLVLSYFDRYGSIVGKKYSPNGGNWIHLKYSNRREAQSSLSQNGKQIASNLMIGVTSRKDKHNLEDISHRMLSTHSPIEVPFQRQINSPTYTSNIRRLTVNNSENDVIPLTNLPMKSSGVVSKTMEYLFGW